MEVFIRISQQRWNYLSEAMKQAEVGIPCIRTFGEANYEYTIANPEHFKMIVYLDHYGLDFKKINPKLQQEIEAERKEIMQLLQASYNKGQKNDTIRLDLDISRNQIYLTLSLRTMLNEIVLGYQNREFYFGFLELFLDAIRS